MKMIQLFAGVAVLFCALSFTSCGKEENLPPITCYFDYDVNEEDPIEHVGLVHRNQTGIILIKGGDGSYRFSNQNDAVVAFENYGSSGLNLTALSVGESVITISDNSGNTAFLLVKVAIPKMVNEFKPRTCLIYGDELTEKEVADLKRELRFVTSYQFFFTYSFDEPYKGSVNLASQEVDGVTTTKTYAFERDAAADKIAPFWPLKIDSRLDSYFLLTSSDEQLLILMHAAVEESDIAPGSRISPPTQPSFTLDVTNRYKVRYPNLERAYLVE